MQRGPAPQGEVLRELMENAVGLPLESQKLLLILAKGMAYTRDCLTRQGGKNQQNNSDPNNGCT